MAHKILIADGDTVAVNLIKAYLEKEHHAVLTAHDGRCALDLIRDCQPDLIILELVLPRIDGLDVCRILRSTSDVPIIVLSSKTGEDDKLLALDLGADDYLTKPFSPRELAARVRTVLRRLKIQSRIQDTEMQFGDLTVNIEQHEVTFAGEKLHLTPCEFKLLSLMAREPGRVFTRGQLLENLSTMPVIERTIDYHVRNLRRKIEPDEKSCIFIQTVFAVGYKFSTGPYS